MNWTLVTGGAKGLGATICKTLAKQGCSILVHYKQSKKLAEKVADECRQLGVSAEIIQGDFSTVASTKQFIQLLLKQHPSIETVINNVGNYNVKPVLETSPEEWQDLYQVNFLAALMITQTLLPSIKKSQGNIINIGVSGLGAMRSNISNTAYGMTKLQLLTLTKTLARELAQFDVRVNMVSPGRLENSIDILPDVMLLPMKRLGTTHEVAQTVAFLLNKDSRYVTGQNIEVAGALGL